VLLAALGFEHIATQVLLSVLLAVCLMTELSQLFALKASYFCSLTHLFDLAFACSLMYFLHNPDGDNLHAIVSFFFWVRSILFLRVFETMSALLLMVGEIINDTRESLILLTMLTFAMAHVFLSGRYLPTKYIAVLFRAVGIGMLGDGFPEEFLPEESSPDMTALDAEVIKIAIFLMCTYVMNMVLMNFLIAVMGDTFERVTEQKQILALRNKARALLEVDAYFPNWMSGRATPRNLLVCEATNEAARWSGFSGEIKREVKRLEDKLQDKLQNMQNESKNGQAQMQAQMQAQLSEQRASLANIAKMLESHNAQGDPSRLTSS
jgi:gas vesicle protein